MGTPIPVSFWDLWISSIEIYEALGGHVGDTAFVDETEVVSALTDLCSGHSPWLWTGGQVFGVALGPLHVLFPLPNNQTFLRLAIGLFRSLYKRPL